MVVHPDVEYHDLRQEAIMIDSKGGTSKIETFGFRGRGRPIELIKAKSRKLPCSSCCPFVYSLLQKMAVS